MRNEGSGWRVKKAYDKETVVRTGRGRRRKRKRQRRRRKRKRS